MPECRVELFAEATEYDSVVVIGQIAPCCRRMPVRAARLNSRRQIVVMDNLATHKVTGIKGGGGRWRRGALTVTPSREGQSL